MGFWPPRSPYLNPYDFIFVGKTQKCCVCQNPHDLEALKQNILEAIYNIQQRELQCSEICLNELRHVSQQRADILNIFDDYECNIICYI
jgi:hypothetical protein